MIIKKLLNDIKVNKFTVIIISLCIFTGMFKELIAISSLIFIHELGHYFFAKVFKWKVKRIIFYPFGGLTIFDDLIDKPLKEEFIITVAGPLFQIIIYYFYFCLNKKYYVSDYFFQLIRSYHYGILFLNLLPIIPLDGSKLLNILLNKFICFKSSYIITLYVSIVLLFISTYYIKNDSSYYLLVVFLVYELINYIKNKRFMVSRFILERKLYNFNYKKYIKITKKENMYRNKKHLFKSKNGYITEKQMLK